MPFKNAISEKIFFEHIDSLINGGFLNSTFKDGQQVLRVSKKGLEQIDIFFKEKPEMFLLVMLFMSGEMKKEDKKDERK